MNKVFADAGYWIALFNPRDQLHNQAITVSQTIEGRSIVTSQMVLTEFLNHFASLGTSFRQQAVEVVRSLQQASEVDIVLQTSELFEKALMLYEQRQDKTWGITDCASILIMNERNSRKEAMIFARDRLNEVRSNILGVVINKMKHGEGRYFYYYYKYDYIGPEYGKRNEAKNNMPKPPKIKSVKKSAKKTHAKHHRRHTKSHAKRK